jgi:hypothetical protein
MLIYEISQTIIINESKENVNLGAHTCVCTHTKVNNILFYSEKRKKKLIITL